MSFPDYKTWTPSSSSTVSGVDTYSTAETLTNKVWIDGKPVYRKVIDVGALPNATTKSVAHGISGITWIVYCGITSTDGTTRIGGTYVGGGTGDIGCYVDATNVTVSTYYNRTTFATSYAILEYTK